MHVETIGMATLWLADCRDVLELIPHVDAVVTDPPYGIDFQYNSHDDNEADWFRLMDAVVPVLKAKSAFFVMPNCRMQSMGWWINTHAPDWIIAWYKGSPGHLSAIGFNDWEPHLCWGKPPTQMHDYFQTPLTHDLNGHPCVKPDAWAEWLVSRAARPTGTVLDPFMGSGTVGVACANLGREFIGIEIDPTYFDIACERIDNAYRQPRLFDEAKPLPDQPVLL